MDTKVTTKEQISALADGELGSEEMTRLRGPAFFQGRPGRWEDYHRIGEVLRSEEMDVSLSAGFSAKMERLADAEPAIVAPQLAPAQPVAEVAPAAQAAASKTAANGDHRAARPGRLVRFLMPSCSSGCSCRGRGVRGHAAASGGDSRRQGPNACGQVASAPVNVPSAIATVADTNGNPQNVNQLSSLAQQGEVSAIRASTITCSLISVSRRPTVRRNTPVPQPSPRTQTSKMHLTGRLYGVLCLLTTLLGFSRHPLMRRMAFPQLRPAKPPLSAMLAQLQKMQSAAQRLNYSGSFVYQQAARCAARGSPMWWPARASWKSWNCSTASPRVRARQRGGRQLHPEQRIVRRESGSPAILSRPSSMRARKTLPATIGCSPTAMSAWPAATARPSCWRRATSCATATVSAPTRPPACRCVHRRWMAGEVIEQIAFTQIDIGGIDRARVNPTYKDTRGWRIEKAAMVPADLSAWQVAAAWFPEDPAGAARVISDSV
jgi:sigma-E factor negative regulatory protein RseA